MHRFQMCDALICVCLGLLSFVIYNANLRSIAAFDTYAARYLPLSMWRNATLALDPIAVEIAQGRPYPARVGEPDRAWWIREGRGGRLVSFYPVVMPILVAPLYLPAVVYLNSQGWDPPRVDLVARVMEKLCASLVASISVGLVYLLLRRRSSAAMAFWLSGAYAFGTTTWVISGQALWMHGPAQLLVVAALLAMTLPCTAIRAAWAGALCALIACIRPPDAVLAAGLGAYGLWWARNALPAFVLAAAVPAGLVLAYNLAYVGHPAGGYALVSEKRLAEFLDPDALSGAAGLLFSPTRGLFVFSPFLLFAVVGIASASRAGYPKGLLAAAGAAVVLQVGLYGFGDWRQGASWGPRWLTDMLPILVWVLPPVVAALSRAGRLVFGAACCLAISIQTVGAVWYAGASDLAVMAAEGPGRMRAAWDPRNAPFLAELKNGPAPRDLLVELRGNIDMIEVRDGPDGARRIDVHGWALAGGRTPAGVAVSVDGRIAAETAGFFDRSDVVTALGVASPSGWKVSFPADRLTTGQHEIAALVRAEPGSEPKFIVLKQWGNAASSEAERRDRALQASAGRAADALRASQQGPGYWLTAFTSTTRFDAPGQEMNAFLNAVLLDLLDPVADKAGLADAVGRARTFLRDQIEPDGLVRYHGRPDAPTIGRLGCAITPDTDDTALVWRVAPSDRRDLLDAALATIATYRRADGLYRTWLAPRERYACLDPGSDPNPADIAIQIHLLMLLAKADPLAARDLCSALRARVDDQRIWAYYRIVPTIVVLRLNDLERAGCPLDLPASRWQTEVPGQEVWVDLARRLHLLRDPARPAGLQERSADLLARIAADDFALLRRTPPLLYHNDLSATVSRYYWSDAFGYALWLRVLSENGRPPPAACSGGGARSCPGK